MLILGIETSGKTGSVALVQDGTLRAERVMDNQGFRHAQMLISEMERLFAEVRSSPSVCDAVAVSIGPGSFTGLRIGVVCAKTFAYSLGCQLTVVDTLQAIAEECPSTLEQVSVIADAQRGDVYVGRYLRQNEGWSREGEIAILPAVEFCRSASPNEIVTGPGLTRWQSEFPAGSQLLNGNQVPKAATICKIGHRQLLAGNVADIWQAEPSYLRISSAEEQWELRNKPSS